MKAILVTGAICVVIGAAIGWMSAAPITATNNTVITGVGTRFLQGVRVGDAK